jgi:Carboxylesterase family
MKIILRIALSIVSIFIYLHASAQNVSLDSSYNYSITKDIIYGGNYNDALHEEDTLKLDLYVPQSSQDFLHPVLIYAHAGGLITGDKSTDKLAPYFGSYFAERGYIFASINYRLGTHIPNDSLQSWANIYCATQDAKSAIRYFHRSDLDYCIDTASIFFCGSSAGASIALTSAYVEQDEFNSHIDTMMFGLLENSSGNAGYSDHLNSIVSCWGGLNDTMWLKGESIPNYLFHGTNDSVVPYYSGLDENGIFLFGSYFLHQASIAYGIESHLHPFVGISHGLKPTSLQFDTLLAQSDTFLFLHLSKKAGKACVITGVNDMPRDGFSLNVRFDEFSKEIVIQNSGADWNGAVELMDLNGRKLMDTELRIPSGQLMHLPMNISAGIYILYLISDGVFFSQKLFAK